MKKPRPMITCIFCNKAKQSSIEHVIPSKLGGILLLENHVCIDCNSTLGSEVDSELLANRHIFDAYLTLKQKGVITKEWRFQFQEQHAIHLDGTKVKLPKTNVNRKALYTQNDIDKSVITDIDDEYPISRIRKRGKDLCLSDSDIDRIVRKFEFFKINEGGGDTFYNRTLGVRFERGNNIVTTKNTMFTNLPHRFVAKACVETAYLLGIENEIGEMPILKRHARYGGKEKLLEFNPSPEGKGDPGSIHITGFCENRFIVSFFACYSIGVKVSLKNQPKQNCLINDFAKRRKCKGELKGDGTLHYSWPIKPL